MRTRAALLFFLLQLRPLAAAVVCLHNMASGTECPMPAPDERSAPGRVPVPLPQHSDHSSPLPGCPAAELCVSPAPVVEPAMPVFSLVIPDHAIAPWFTSTIHSAEAAAPPAPPPNG
jgi:hypothetical protein